MAGVVLATPAWCPCESCDCDAEGNSSNRWKIRGILSTNRCPRRQITADSQTWLELYPFYRDRVLAVAGGILDQPHAYMQAMRILRTWMSKEDGS